MYKNTTNVPLALAVWLTRDEYEHSTNPKEISATGLIKPIKQIILGMRVPESDIDLSTVIASRMGTAIHNSIEASWTEDYKAGLSKLGYPQKLVDSIVINPEKVEPGDIAIYLEKRTKKEIDGFIISGQFDFVSEGQVQDFKTTSTYTYINGSNDDKYIKQASIYAWLNPDIITYNKLAIHFIFTDWSAMQAKINKAYPQTKILEHTLHLMPIAETERFIKNKLADIKKYSTADEADIPECNSEDLWQRDPVWKYYKNPASLKRSTKNFDNLHDANMRLADDGNVGKVVEVLGEVVACRYCSALPICKQKDTYILNNTLKL